MMVKKFLSTLVLPAVAFATLLTVAPQAQASSHAYVMMLEERTFGQTPHVYVVLGQDRKSGKWNLPGGNQEQGDPTRAAAAARELKEETGGLVDRTGDVPFWSNLKSYEHGAHKVFIFEPGTNAVPVKTLDATVAANAQNKKLHYTLREMKAYELVKLMDLIALANNQPDRVQNNTGKYDAPPALDYQHAKRGKMKLDEWMLFTLKSANVHSVLKNYKY
jgi:8-oxo-dGTP pyrophosphatase MutT (NUDIX family)